jgi:hypothetical protein
MKKVVFLYSLVVIIVVVTITIITTEADRLMRDGDLARDLSGAMSTSQKQSFNQKLAKINARISEINYLEAKGMKSVGAIMRRDLAESYAELAGLIDNALPNVRTGLAAKNFSESLKRSRTAVLDGSDLNLIKDLKLSSRDRPNQFIMNGNFDSG